MWLDHIIPIIFSTNSFIKSRDRTNFLLTPLVTGLYLLDLVAHFLDAVNSNTETEAMLEQYHHDERARNSLEK